MASSNPFRFSDYTYDELRSCGASFEEEARQFEHVKPNATTSDWTEFILDWFTATVAPRHTVDARRAAGSVTPLLEGLPRRDTRGEFLVDLTHTTYPDYSKDDYGTANYWTRAVKSARGCEVKLALESELGTFRNPDRSLAQVLEDAAKVAAFRANVKVVVFASEDGSRKDQWVRMLEALRTQSKDSAPWLWADVPWENSRGGLWQPSHGVLS